MDQIEYPTIDVWESRREWFENTLEGGQYPYASYIVNDHATALLVDLQSCYCAGAWLAVIILSISIIDAQLRDEVGDNKMNTAILLKTYFTGKDIDWLRKLRNQYVHVNLDSPALSMDDHYTNRTVMQANAERAIGMVIHAFFQDPGT